MESGQFEVYTEENSHFDDGERRFAQSFASYAEAVIFCKSIVDDFLKDNYAEKMAADDLFRLYMTFGEDAFIIGGDAPGNDFAPLDEKFSAREYARARSREICAGRNEF